MPLNVVVAAYRSRQKSMGDHYTAERHGSQLYIHYMSQYRHDWTYRCSVGSATFFLPHDEAIARIRVGRVDGRADGQKRCWSQLNNSTRSRPNGW